MDLDQMLSRSGRDHLARAQNLVHHNRRADAQRRDQQETGLGAFRERLPLRALYPASSAGERSGTPPPKRAHMTSSSGRQ
jgi:hypothetical protein